MIRPVLALALTLFTLPGQDTQTTETSAAVAEVLGRIDKARLKEQVEKLVSFKTRNTLSNQKSETEGIGAAARWLLAQFREIAKEAKAEAVVNTHTYAFRGTQAQNVYLWIKGRRAPRRAIVYGGHYDSINSAARDPNGPAPGANDNASGTSGVLELARAFAPLRPDTGIIFAAFSGEEQGLQGARAFEAFLRQTGVQVPAMVNTDIIGGSRGDDGGVDTDTFRCFSAGPEGSDHRVLARYIKYVAELYQPAFKVRIQDRIDRPRRGGDHQPFSDAGVPAARLMVTNEELRKQHGPGDLPEHMDWDYLHKMAKVVASVLGNLADGPEPPREVRARGEEVTWRAATGAERYVVFVRKSGSNEVSKTLVVGAPKASVPGLSAGDGVAVSAVSKDRAVGQPSSEATAE